MGGVWLERNMSEMLSHMFSLASNPRASVFHVDAVYARKCVMFMLRSLVGGLLGERAQVAAAKEICLVIVKQMNTLGMLGRRYLCPFSSFYFFINGKVKGLNTFYIAAYMS